MLLEALVLTGGVMLAPERRLPGAIGGSRNIRTPPGAGRTPEIAA